MKKIDNRKKPLTPELLAECSKLKNIFDSKKKELGISQGTIADAMAVNQSSISHYLNGVNALNAQAAAIFARLLQVNISDFSPRLAKEIENIAGGVIGTSQNNLSSNNQSNIKSLNSETAKMFSYPVIEWDDIENFLDRRLSPTKFRSMVVSVKNIENGFWLEVTDDLMSCLSSPSFPEGSLILVDPNINKIENGKFLLIEHKEEKLFRQIVKNSGTTYLKTLNDKYLPVPINDNECKVLGKIVGLFIEILD